MKIQTRDFGELEIREDEIIHFKQPIFGFESHKKFVIISDQEIGDQFVWLQSAHDPSVCFILVNIVGIMPQYSPQINEESLQILQVTQPSTLTYWTIAVIQEDFKASTHNLKSPILINKANRYAAQIILDGDYPVRALLFDQEEEAVSC